MKLLEAPVKTTHTNPIQDWYETNTKHYSGEIISYKNGMFISIDNKHCYYTDLVKEFRDLYISLTLAISDTKLSKTKVKQLLGQWKSDRITLPSREQLLSLLNNKIPILVGGVHNYRKDDPRSKGKEYTHSHFYVYNTHHYLPSDPKELRDIEDKIERHLSRYIKAPTHKRFQGIIKVKPVMDNVSPLQLYDYLQSPITNPLEENLINYIASNRHLPSIQYPLTTIYSTQKFQ